MFNAIRHGICTEFFGVSCPLVRQAVVNLGAGDYVAYDSPTWWIKGYRDMSKLEVMYTRWKILRKVGGLKAIKAEIYKINRMLTAP